MPIEQCTLSQRAACWRMQLRELAALGRDRGYPPMAAAVDVAWPIGPPESEKWTLLAQAKQAHNRALLD